MLIRMLLVLEPGKLRTRLQTILAEFDVDVTVGRARGDFWKHVGRENADLIVVRPNMLPKPAVKSVTQLRGLPDRPDVILISDHENPQERAGFLAAGCLGVLNDQLLDEEFRKTLGTFIERRAEWQAARSVSDRIDRPAVLSDFVSASASMQAFIALSKRVVATDSALLILGETGVGKERLARAIHNEGPRAAGPFIAVNCGGLPEALLESELFGHEEGAFTGATRARRGFFELAHRGTIFLDEIGEMAIHLQVKLLRVLQDYEIQRVGSEKTIPVDVRIMAATNRDLETEIENKAFRRDLFYRLAVVTLTVPPLRDRREDILDLTESYIAHFNVRLGRAVRGLSAEARQSLLDYAWPGNVRELINVMERAVLLCAGDEITPADMPVSVRGSFRPAGGMHAATAANGDLLALPEGVMDKVWSEARRDVLEHFERAYLERLLNSNAGRIADTAAQAGIQPRSLFQKMKQLGLRKEDFKPRTRRPG